MRASLLAGLALAGAAAAQSPAAVVVDPRGGGNSVRTVAEGLRRVQPGGRLLVRAGVYAESTLVVDRPVTIEGERGAVLDGGGAHQIMTVVADDVTVRGLTFRDVAPSFVEDRAAIKVLERRRCVIERNRFEQTFFAVYLSKVAGCAVRDNEIRARGRGQMQSGSGVHAWYSRDVTITGNRISGHRDGIYLEFARGAVVERNVSEGNNRYGIHFMFSDSCRYRDNVFRENTSGVAVMYSRAVEMTGNRFERNWGAAAYGLLLKEIEDSRIAGNTFARNSVGVLAEGTSRLQLTDNDFVDNGWALRITASSIDDRLERNNFVGNSFDVATNSLANNSVFAGNYWDAYRGYDLRRDGVGDVPFRPVRLFAYLVEQNPPALILLRSVFVDLLDAAERVVPALTPETLVDARPSMKPIPHSVPHPSPSS